MSLKASKLLGSGKFIMAEITPEEKTADQLYALKDRLKAKRTTGRGPDAAHARWYKRTMLKRVNAELRRRKLPATQPGDNRVYGPGRAAFQRANGG